MIKFKVLLFLLPAALLIGCGGSEDSRPGSDAEIDEMESAVTDSIISDLDKTTKELQSISEEVERAIEELEEDN